MPIPSPSTPIEGIVWPSITARGVPGLANLIRSLAASQWLSAEELERNALRQLAITARYCERESPFFAERLKHAGLTPTDVAAPGGLSALPPMTRRQIQDAGEALFCRNVPESHMPTRERRTSGSTGEPLAVRRTEVGNLLGQALTMRDYLWQGSDFTAPLLIIRAGLTEPVETPDWGPPVSFFHPSAPAASLPITTPVAEQAARLHRMAPGTLVSFPNNLAALVDELVATGSPLPSVRSVRTFGETLTDDVRQRTKSCFGVDVVDNYSASEAGMIAAQCPDCGTYHVMSDALIVEVLDDSGKPCGPGEVGRVVITDFTNFATPIIRYEIGDYAEVGDPGTCGRGLSVLRRIVGRTRNLMILPDGRRQWPLTGYDRFREIAPIFQFQFVQTDRTTIEVHLVTARDLTDDEERALSDVILAALGHPFRLELRYHSAPLQRSASGKSEEFVCRVAL